MAIRLPLLPTPALRILGNDLYNDAQLMQYALDTRAAPPSTLQPAPRWRTAAYTVNGGDVLGAIHARLDECDPCLGKPVVNPMPPSDMLLLRSASAEIRRLRALVAAASSASVPPADTGAPLETGEGDAR